MRLAGVRTSYILDLREAASVTFKAIVHYWLA